MTLAELRLIKDQLEQFKGTVNLSSTTNRNITKSIWVIKREIELKTKCVDTKYSNSTGE